MKKIPQWVGYALMFVFLGLVGSAAIQTVKSSIKESKGDPYHEMALYRKAVVTDFSLTIVSADSAKAIWLETTRNLGAEAARPQLIIYCKLMARADSLRNDYNRWTRVYDDAYFTKHQLPRFLY